MELTFRITGGSEAQRRELIKLIDDKIKQDYYEEERLRSMLKDPATEDYLYLKFRSKA